ncbi:MAG: hypothetical protein Q6373_024620 [Candidatus Sigynarchaeota archaeon]
MHTRTDKNASNVLVKTRIGHESCTTFPVQDSRADDWIGKLFKKPAPQADIMLPLRLFRDFHVISAGHEITEGRTKAAIFHFKLAAQACFDLGENAMCNNLLDRADAAQMDLANGLRKDSATKLGKKASLSRYIDLLRNEASDAIKKGDLSHARDVLRQIVVLGKDIGDKRMVKDYRSQLRSIEMIYSVKGRHSVTIQKVFASRLVHTLKEATLRRELAFRMSFAQQINVLQPILALPLLLPLSNKS